MMAEIRNIVLLGKTGTGKSSTANMILGRKEFTAKLSSNSVTSKTQFGRCDLNGKRVTVIDTPGFHDTGGDPELITKEIVKCVTFVSRGLHALILVKSIGRVTKEDAETIEYFMKVFGNQLEKYMIVLFTRGDDLAEEGGSIDNYVRGIGSGTDASLRNLLHRCENRYIAFNNRANGTEAKQQVANLMKMVDSMVEKNGNQPYVETFIRQAQLILHEKEEARLAAKREAQQVQFSRIREEERQHIREKIEEEEADDNNGSMFKQILKLIVPLVATALGRCVIS